ncbi:hypothetical protein [Nocardia cyriacigeorgica]|nr:hypothetical protein [Nocardia cyriacigeorgica]
MIAGMSPVRTTAFSLHQLVTTVAAEDRPTSMPNIDNQLCTLRPDSFCP